MKQSTPRSQRLPRDVANRNRNCYWSGRGVVPPPATSLCLPSATFAQGYDTYPAALGNGETVTGIRVCQAGDSHVRRNASSAETLNLGGPAVNVERQKLSLMPEGLLGAMSDAEIRDLFAYLQSLR